MLITVFLCAIIGLIFTIDFFVKRYFDTIHDNILKKRESTCSGFVKLEPFRNRGFAGSLSKDNPVIVAVVSLTISILGTIFFIIGLGHKGNRIILTGLSFILGGAYSNTYERLTKKYVVDYIRFNVKNKCLSRLVFNISDFCILMGALLVTIGTVSEEI